MKNQLLQGDALTILPTLEANSFDALITDSPYANGGLTAAARAKPPSQKYVQGGGAQLHADLVGDERDQRSHLKWMHLWLSECARVLKDGAPVLLFTDWRQLPLTTDALQIAGFTWRGITVWDKCGRNWAASATRPSTSCGAARATCRWIVARRCCRE